MASSSDVRVVAHFVGVDGRTHFYVEWSSHPVGRDDPFKGFAVIPGTSRAEKFLLSENQLTGGNWAGKVQMVRDGSFKTKPWAQVNGQHFPPQPTEQSETNPVGVPVTA